MAIERCKICGANLALVGSRHRCVPKPDVIREFRRPLAKNREQTLTATRPWEAEGISRRTWYRRQREKRA